MGHSIYFQVSILLNFDSLQNLKKLPFTYIKYFKKFSITTTVTLR